MEHQEGLTWQALQWADGTRQVGGRGHKSVLRLRRHPVAPIHKQRKCLLCRYEGLTKNGKLLHSHGVLTFPNKDR